MINKIDLKVFNDGTVDIGLFRDLDLISHVHLNSYKSIRQEFDFDNGSFEICFGALDSHPFISCCYLVTEDVAHKVIDILFDYSESL